MSYRGSVTDKLGLRSVRSFVALGALLAAATLLVLAATASAAPSAESRRTEAARWTVWYVRINNQLLGTAFGRGERTRSGRFSAPKPGILRFTDTRGTITGTIRCIPTTPGNKREFGCRWAITVKRRGFYWGTGWIKFYVGGGFNYSAPFSYCKSLVRGSKFCRRYPPPKG